MQCASACSGCWPHKPRGAPDFDLRQVRIVELLARRAAHILLNAYDPATGLLTRPAFEKRAQAAMRTDARVENCVIYVDIDRLHVLNENLGLHVGDEVIVRVAEVIRRALAPRMLASRISGDRFAVLMVEAPLDRGREFAEMLCDRLAGLDFIAGGKAAEVSASFGVAQRRRRQPPLRMRSPRRRSPARLPRTAAATASSCTKTATKASCAVTPT